MIGVFAAVARARDPEAPAPPVPETVELSAEDDLPSAIDALDEVQQEVALSPGIQDWIPLPGNLVRGKLFVRPVLGAETLAGHGGAARLGAAAGHRWWTLAPLPVSVGGEERLELSAPLGSATGRRAALAVVAGPWVGPVGLRLGPTATWEQARWGALRLDPAGLVGVRADLTARAGPLGATVGLEPAWIVTGDRGPAPGSVFPVVGDETAWRAGLGWIGENAGLTLDGEARETAIGTVLGATVGIRVSIL